MSDDFLNALFGNIFKPVGEGIGDAGKAVGEGIKDLSHSVFKSLNYWASLIEDFHTGSPERKKAARLIIAGVFGPIDESIDLSIDWDLQLRLGGFDSSVAPLRIAVMLDTLSTIGTLEEHIKNASRADVNFRRVDGRHPPAPTNEEENRLAMEEFQRRVKEAAQKAAHQIFFPAAGQEFLNSLSREDRRKYPPSLEALEESEREKFEKSKDVVRYRRGLLAKELEDLVMLSTVDQKAKPHPDRATITQPWWLQPFITLLVPKSDLEAHPNLQVSMIIHKHDDSEKRLRQFHDEFEFPMKRLRKNAIESEHDLGVINYVGVVVNLSTA